VTPRGRRALPVFLPERQLQWLPFSHIGALTTGASRRFVSCHVFRVNLLRASATYPPVLRPMAAACASIFQEEIHGYISRRTAAVYSECEWWRKAADSKRAGATR
jgi:hypothetical protein